MPIYVATPFIDVWFETKKFNLFKQSLCDYSSKVSIEYKILYLILLYNHILIY